MVSQQGKTSTPFTPEEILLKTDHFHQFLD